jgi:SAM-dependent methyltransferase
MNHDAVRTAVRERYARIVTGSRQEAVTSDERSACCGPSCCAPDDAPAEPAAAAGCCGDAAPLTFSDGRGLPSDIANSSLGCGAPLEAAAVRSGDVVVDLGSGAGLDAIFAADRAGPTGRAIGVDMTPEMIAKARGNATRLGIENAEFRLGEIEHLPVADETADVVVSNCVINLLPDKRPAFAEAFRVLRTDGRMVISDIVSDGPLPDAVKTIAGWTACLAGAIARDEYLRLIKEAGFVDVEVVSATPYVIAGLASITVRAVKPRTN